MHNLKLRILLSLLASSSSFLFSMDEGRTLITPPSDLEQQQAKEQDELELLDPEISDILSTINELLNSKSPAPAIEEEEGLKIMAALPKKYIAGLFTTKDEHSITDEQAEILAMAHALYTETSEEHKNLKKMRTLCARQHVRKAIQILRRLNPIAECPLQKYFEEKIESLNKLINTHLVKAVPLNPCTPSPTIASKSTRSPSTFNRIGSPLFFSRSPYGR